MIKFSQIRVVREDDAENNKVSFTATLSVGAYACGSRSVADQAQRFVKQQLIACLEKEIGDELRSSIEAAYLSCLRIAKTAAEDEIVRAAFVPLLPLKLIEDDASDSDYWIQLSVNARGVYQIVEDEPCRYAQDLDGSNYAEVLIRQVTNPMNGLPDRLWLRFDNAADARLLADRPNVPIQITVEYYAKGNGQ